MQAWTMTETANAKIRYAWNSSTSTSAAKSTGKRGPYNVFSSDAKITGSKVIK